MSNLVANPERMPHSLGLSRGLEPSLVTQRMREWFQAPRPQAAPSP